MHSGGALGRVGVRVGERRLEDIAFWILLWGWEKVVGG